MSNNYRLMISITNYVSISQRIRHYESFNDSLDIASFNLQGEIHEVGLTYVD